MEIKGMTIEQFKEIVEFVQKYHSFASVENDEETKEKLKLYPKISEYGFNIKYVDCCYDSRTSDIWMVKFRGFGHLYFSTNIFVSLTGKKPDNFNYDNLFDWIMDFLKGEWHDEKIINKYLIPKKKW